MTDRVTPEHAERRLGVRESAAAARVVPDWCPGVLRLHAAGDGGLARVRLPGGRLTLDALRALRAAAGLGNGDRRGDLARERPGPRAPGRRPRPVVAELLRAGGLLPSPEHDRVRNIAAQPARRPAARRRSRATDDARRRARRGGCAPTRRSPRCRAASCSRSTTAAPRSAAAAPT